MKRFALCFGVLLSSALALAQNKAGPDIGWTDGNKNGAFTYSIPLEVPPFHGIEPRLSLEYSSSANTGIVGVGWTLTGFTVIERVSPGRGAPGYDGGVTATTDNFMLDGEELIACPVGSSSPSCTTGGNFTFKVESYEKILYDSGVDTWTITDRDGTVSLYAPVYQVTSSNTGNINGKFTWRYGLQSVTDTSGNTVAYHWDSGQFSANWAYPTSISYNGNTISFSWVQTTNPPIYATGGYKDFTTVAGAIQSIDVQVSGSRLRTYALTYSTSSSSGQPLLTSVQEYGKDATLNGSGQVTGGTSLPAISLG